MFGRKDKTRQRKLFSGTQRWSEFGGDDAPHLVLGEAELIGKSAFLVHTAVTGERAWLIPLL